MGFDLPALEEAGFLVLKEVNQDQPEFVEEEKDEESDEEETEDSSGEEEESEQTEESVGSMMKKEETSKSPTLSSLCEEFMKFKTED